MITLALTSSVTLVLLLLCSGFISSAETCLFSLDKTQILRIRETNPLAATRIEHLLSNVKRLLFTLLLTNTVVNVAAASTGLFLATLLVSEKHSEWIAIVSVTGLTLIFGEMAPKRLALMQTERMAILYAPILSVLLRWLSPAHHLMELLTKSITHTLTPTYSALSEDEYRAVVETSEKKGILDEEEREMVDGIIRLDDIQASDVMTPRVDMVAMDIDDTRLEHYATASSVRFKFLPIFKGTRDNVVGLLHIPFYLMSPDRDINNHIAPVYSVPENATLATLLTAFQGNRQGYAIVVDEHGGTAGVITLGDILEEIVDDVQGEHEADTLTIEPQGASRWLVSGSTSLEDLNYELNTELEAEGADRIAGWVTAHTGQVARVGECVEAQGCRVTVRQVRRHRITTVILEKITSPAGDPT